MDPLSPEQIEAEHKLLLENSQWLQCLLNERCFTLQMIEKLQIGLVKHGKYWWYSFPVADKEGVYHFKKLKALPKKGGDQPSGLVFPKGGGSALYPLQLFDENNDTILLCEGEADTVAALSIGLPAICGTAGASTFKEEWIESLKEGKNNKKLIVAYDNDKTGREGTKKVLELFVELCPEWEFAIIEWPEDFPDKSDVTDFMHVHKDSEPCSKLIALAESYQPPTPTEKLIAELSKDSLPRILPVQSFYLGTGYYALSLRKLVNSKEKKEKKERGEREDGIGTYIVTSQRECFACKDEEFAERGLGIERMPAIGDMSRWDQAQLLDYLQGTESLSIEDIYQYIMGEIKKYLDFVDPRFFQCVSLWIIASYFYRIFPAFPYLHITGHWGSGKTKALQVISQLAFNGEMLTSSSSPASIVRLVHLNGATCCIDEAEELWNARSDYTSILQEILRSGYKRGITVTKCERVGADDDVSFKVVNYDPYSPKALAGIEGLAEALYSRCIQIVMMRTRKPEIANREVDVESSDWSDLRSMIYPAALSAFPAVHKELQTVKMGNLLGRDAELWRPIITMAVVADPSGKLSEQMLSFAMEVQQKRRYEEKDTVASKVLECLMNMLKDQNEEEAFLIAKGVFDSLYNFDEEFAWLEDPREKTRRGKWLNGVLKRLDLWSGPAQLRSITGDKVRGYFISQKKILEAAQRYNVSFLDEEQSSSSHSSQTG